VNVKRDALRVHGNDKITWYKSSEKVERGFCSVCGSTLFWKPNIEGYEYTAVAMGALEARPASRHLPRGVLHIARAWTRRQVAGDFVSR
jgi:hypothetical protein